MTPKSYNERLYDLLGSPEVQAPPMTTPPTTTDELARLRERERELMQLYEDIGPKAFSIATRSSRARATELAAVRERIAELTGSATRPPVPPVDREESPA